MLGIFLVCFYGTFAGITLVNLLFMRRVVAAPGLDAREFPEPFPVPHVSLRSAGSATPPSPSPFSEKGRVEPEICVLIPARNEAGNLERLLPALVGPKIYVFDDESEDGTAEVARKHGAIVLRPREPLPEGWTGKNRACHELAKAAAEDSDADWILFLDADVYPEKEFVSGVEALTRAVPRRTALISGFPRIIPGAGIEPLFLGWVGWVLLATNPYGLVTVSGKGHNRFTNGQFGCWRMSTYTDLWPHELLKGRILEDVLIGRLCAKRGIGVEIVNLSSVLAVKMYSHWRETLDGMSKNSYEITGSVAGSIGLALLLLFVAWGWLLAGHVWIVAAGLFGLSGLFAALTVRSKPYGLPLLPVIVSIGAFTVVRSIVWHRRGKVVWKGRTYPGHRS